MDDAELNRRFRTGDEAAVRAVYQRYGGAMFAVAMSTLGDRELAADCVQQAFVRAWRGANSFDPARELRPWLATITRRVATDIHRKEARTHSEPHAEVDATVVPIAFEQTWEAFEVRTCLHSSGRPPPADAEGASCESTRLVGDGRVRAKVQTSEAAGSIGAASTGSPSRAKPG